VLGRRKKTEIVLGIHEDEESRELQGPDNSFEKVICGGKTEKKEEENCTAYAGAVTRFDWTQRGCTRKHLG